MPNMRDVAKTAGVGVGTVSRMINGNGYVSEDTKQRVQDAMDQLGYSGEKLGRLPRNKKPCTYLIGVMVPDIENPFFSKMLRYLDAELRRNGYKGVFCNTYGVIQRPAEMLEMLDDHKIDGIISCADAPQGFDGRGDRPIVCMDRRWGKGVPLVRSDHTMGGRLAAAAFLKAGCRKVVQFMGGHSMNYSANLRHKILEDVLKEKGCEVTSIFMEWDVLSYRYNKESVMKYWDILRDSDGCLANDIGALSCQMVLQKQGVRVPEDFRIIAYDGTELTNLGMPELSAVQQDCQLLARTCVDVVQGMIDGQEPEQEIYEVPVKWVKRGTT